MDGGAPPSVQQLVSLGRRVGEPHVGLGEEEEIVPGRLPVSERNQLDVGQRDEADLGTVERIGEPALIAVRGQRDATGHEVAIGFEENPLSALLASLEGLDDLDRLGIGFHGLGIGRTAAKP